MKKLAINLKLWQILLIVTGVVLLAAGGSVTYVALTSGIGPKDIYPEDVSFVIPEEDSSYNKTLGQFEESEDFSLTIGTATEEVNKKQIQLSFTKSFTETANEQGFISSGAITIPQYVTIGEEFTVQINKATNADEGYGFLKDGDSINIGGVSNIYAMTENKVILPTSTKVAIDVPVYDIGIELYDKASGNKVSYSESTSAYNVVEGSEIEVRTTFIPAASQYIYSDNDADKTEKRTKDVYVSISSGNENFATSNVDGKTILTATGELSAISTISAYVFKNSLGQVNFDNSQSEASASEKYSTAIQYLSRAGSSAVANSADMVIVQAEVSKFNMAEGVKSLSCYTNQLKTISADDLSLQIMETVNGNDYLLKSMIKNVGIRILEEVTVEEEKTYIETSDVVINKSNSKVITVGDNHYTLINANLKNWEISSKVNKTYKMEIVLLLHDTEAEQAEKINAKAENRTANSVYKLYETKYEVDLIFTEAEYANVSWTTDEINMVIYPNETSAQYDKKLTDLIDMSSGINNTYKKAIFFAQVASGSVVGSLSDYINCASIPYTQGVGSKYSDKYLIDGDTLVIKKGLNGFTLNIYFAIVKTDAYGEKIITGDNICDVVQDSVAKGVVVVESISEFADDKFNITFADDSQFIESTIGEEEYNKYVVAKGTDEFTLEITLGEKSLALFADQTDKMTIKAIGKYNVITETYSELDGILDISAANITTGKVTYTLKITETADLSVLSNGTGEIEIGLRFIYTIGTRSQTFDIFVKVNETPAAGEVTEKYITVYESKPATIVESGDALADKYEINPEDHTQLKAAGESDYTTGLLTDINNAISGLQVKDKYGRVLSDKTVSLSSSNEDCIIIDENTITIATSAQGVANVVISCGTATPRQITFTTSDISIESIKMNDGTEYKSDFDEIEGSVAGEKGTLIRLSDCVDEIVLSTRSTLSGSNLYYTINNISVLSDKEKAQLYGTNGMLNVGVTASSLASNTRITNITINHNFGKDVAIPIYVFADNGISFIMTINILKSVEIKSVTLKDYRYVIGGNGSNTEIIPASYSVDNYTAVYGGYAISLSEIIKAKKGEDEYVFEAKYINDGTDTVLCDDDKVTFKEEYEPTKYTYTFYEVADNDYGFTYTLNCIVYPNLVFNARTSNEVNLIEVAKSGVSIGEIFSITKYAYIGTNSSTGLTDLKYKVNENNFEVEIKDDKFVRAKASVGGKDKVLNLTSTYDLFKVFNLKVYHIDTTTGEEITVKNYQGEDFIESMKLTLGFTLEDFATSNNAWIYGIVKYNGRDYLLANYFAASTSGKDIVEQNSDYILYVEKSQPLTDKQTITTIQFNAQNSGLVVSCINMSIKISENTVAQFRLPVILSTIGNAPYVYYNDYNSSSENFDYIDLFDSEFDKASATLNAGGTYNIINNGQGFKHDDTGVTVELEIAKQYTDSDGVELANIVDNKLKLNNLVANGSDVYILVKGTFSCSGVETVAYFRVKVNPNVTVSPVYESEAKGKYLEIEKNSSQNLALGNCFKVKYLEGEEITDLTGTYSITSLKIAGVEQAVNAGAGVSSVTANGVTVTISGSTATFTLTEKVEDVIVIIRKVYDSIANGGTDYKVYLNKNEYSYNIEYEVTAGAGTIIGDIWDVNPISSELTITTKQTAKGASISSVVNANLSKTEVVFYYSAESHAGTFTFENNKIKFNLSGQVTKSYDVTAKFTVTIYEDADKTEIAFIKTLDQVLTIHVNSTIKFVENTGEIYGGSTNLSELGSFKEFKTSSNKYENKSISPNNIKLEFDSTELTGTSFSIPALNEDKTIKFTITYSSYEFVVTRLVKKNVVYANGSALSDSAEAADVYVYTDAYYAGASLDIPLENKFIKYLSNGRNSGDYSTVEETLEGVTSYSISGQKLTITYGNVATEKNFITPIKVKYTSDSYEFEFYIKLSITVKPNVVAVVNYPNPTGVEGQELTADTITSGTTINSSYLQDNVTFGTTKRVQFNKAVGEGSVTDGWTISFDNASAGVSITSGTISLTEGVTTGTVDCKVTCNAVVATYKLYVVADSIYTYKINSTTTRASDIETVYADNIYDGKIFEDDRLVCINVTNSKFSTYSGQDFTLVFEYAGSGTGSEHPATKVEFKLLSSYINTKQYIEAGRSLVDYELTKIIIGEDEYSLGSTIAAIAAEFDALRKLISTTERVIFQYKTTTGSVAINKSKITGIKNIDITNSEAYTSGTDYNTVNGLTYQGVAVTYKFKFDVDIDVDYGSEASETFSKYIAISANANRNTSTISLVSLAGIKHPLTGKSISKSDFGTANSTLEIYNASAGQIDAATYYEKFKTNFNNYATDMDATLNKMKAGVSFLELTAVKGDDETKSYDYEIIANGAANNGSWVMLIYTYKVAINVSKTFYIMVYITPDYSVTIGGNGVTNTNATGEDESSLHRVSISTNSGNPYEVSYNTNKYEINITKPNGTGVVNIARTNISTSEDISSSWSYKITRNEEEGVGQNKTTYNSSNDMSKISYGSSTLAAKITDNKAVWSPSDLVSNGLTWAQETSNIFGRKNFKILIYNEYGYECTFYFDFLPINTTDPQVASKMDTIKEGESFDVGAIYDLVELTAEATERLNFYNGTELLFYSTGDFSSVSSYDSTKNITEAKPGKYKSGDSTHDYITINRTDRTEYWKVEGLNDGKLQVGSTITDPTDSDSTKVYTAIKEPNYYLNSTTSIAPSTTDSTKNVVNLSGINAWGYSSETIKNINANRINNTDSPYLDQELMLGATVTIQEVNYYYGDVNLNLKQNPIRSSNKAITTTMISDDGGNNIPAGTEVKYTKETGKDTYKITYNSVTLSDITANQINFDKTLATKDGLHYDGIISGQTGVDKLLYRELFTTDSDAITIPTLPGWVYSNSANIISNKTYDSTEQATITIKITLKFQKGTQIETKDVSFNVNVERKLNVQKNSPIKGTVADGTGFELKDMFTATVDGSILTLSGTSPSYEIYDDTLVVTLPANSSLTIGGYIGASSESRVATITSIPVSNLDNKVVTKYISISENLKQVSTNAPYVLKAGDKINLELSGYGNNESLTSTGDKKYFSISYAGTELTGFAEADSKMTKSIDVAKFTANKDKINIEDSSLFYNKVCYNNEGDGVSHYTYKRGASVIKSYVFEVTIGGTPNYYRVEKEYFVTPKFYLSNDVTRLGENSIDVKANTELCKIIYTKPTGDTISIENVELSKLDNIKATTLQSVTDGTNTIATNTVLTSFELNANGTYKITSGSVIIDNVSVKALKFTGTTKEAVGTIVSGLNVEIQYQYKVTCADWITKIGYFNGKGTTSNTTKDTTSTLLSAVDKGYLRIVIEGQAVGAAKVDGDGNITTWGGYNTDGSEFISVKIFVKAAGYDGSFATEDANYDHYLGSFKLHVKNPKYITV